MSRVQVVPQSNGWAVLHDGRQTGELYETQKVAEQAGRQLAAGVQAEFQLHGQDGQNLQKDSFGNDPSAIRG